MYISNSFSFLFLSKTYHNLYIHLFVDRYPGYFRLISLWRKLSWTYLYESLGTRMASFLLWVGLLGLGVSTLSVLWETACHCSEEVVPLYISTSSVLKFLLCHILGSISLVSLRFWPCMVLSQCGFNLRFPND